MALHAGTSGCLLSSAVSCPLEPTPFHNHNSILKLSSSLDMRDVIDYQRMAKGFGKNVTDDEKRRQRIELECELDKAKEDLANFQEHAERLADGLESVAATLRKNVKLHPSADDFSAEAQLENRVSPDKELVVNFPAVVKAIEDMRLTRQKISNLQQRKKRLTNGRTFDTDS